VAFYSIIKKNKDMPFPGKLMELEMIIALEYSKLDAERQVITCFLLYEQSRFSKKGHESRMGTIWEEERDE
jgi:hypothetical protein